MTATPDARPRGTRLPRLARRKQLLGAAPINDKAGLQGAFSKLGMSPNMVSQFSPIVTDYVSKAGGQQAGNLLAGVLK